MAAWQLDLTLIPRQSVEGRGLCVDDHIEQEQYERIAWWEGYALPPQYRQQISSFAPWSKPWSEGWEVYGEEDGNRVDVIGEGGRVEEVRVRIDAREPDVGFLEQLVDFAKSIDGVFFSPDMRIIAPDLRAIWVELELSPAAGFIRDPAGTLERLERTERARRARCVDDQADS